MLGFKPAKLAKKYPTPPDPNPNPIPVTIDDQSLFLIRSSIQICEICRLLKILLRWRFLDQLLQATTENLHCKLETKRGALGGYTRKA